MSVNASVLGIGFAAIVALLAARVAVPAWRLASARPAAGLAAPAAGRRAGVVPWITSAAAPVAMATGVRFALHRGGRGAVPVRSAIAGAILAIGAVAGAVTFSANLLHLVSTPRLYGQDWDAAVDIQFATFTPADFATVTASAPGLAGWTYGVHGTLGIGKDLIPAIGLAPGRGAMLSPTVWPAGRRAAPVRSSWARRCCASTACESGIRSRSRWAPRRAPCGSWAAPCSRLSARAASPRPTSAWGRRPPRASWPPRSRPTASRGRRRRAWYNFALVRFAPGTSHVAGVAALTRALAAPCAESGQATCVLDDQRPNTVVNYASIDATPAVLAAVLAVLAFGVLGQFLLSSARRRRRDLAVLKVLGMLRGQLASVAAWQAGTVTAIALALGLPLGIAGGHWAWAAFASAAGLSTAAVTPLPVLWMIPAALAVALLIAAQPGWTAARLRPAAVLRAE